MLGEPYKKGLDIEEMFGTFALNLMMRIVGFLIRSITILVGLIVIIIFFFVATAIFLIWTIFPILIVVFFISGIRLLLN